MSALSPRALAVLRAVAATFIPGVPADLADRVAANIGALPRPADRAELDLVLRLLDSRLGNLLLTGAPRRFTLLPPADREAYLRAWGASRLAPKRKAFHALKRLVAVTHYATLSAARPLGYPGPLGPAPATPKPIRPLAIDRDTTLACDVAIVGSGAGGAVVAAELAARGRDVMVLEKGAYRSEADFTHEEADGLATLYDARGLLATRDLGVVLLQGATLGGGTVINYTTSFPTPDAVRAEWAREHALPHFETAEFTASLDAVARRIGVNTAHAAPSTRDRVLIRGLERLGWHHGILPRNVRGCPQDDACGYCGYGCRTGAKQSTLVTYLRDAADRGARIVVHADVRRAIIEAGRAAGVEAMVGGHRLTVRARAVVVAAGAIHSPALLFRSGVRLPALGRHLALHPATAVFGEMDEEIRPWTGTVQAHYSDQFADLDRGYGFKFETAPVHPSLLALAAPWESGARYASRMARLAHTALCGILLRDRFGGRVRVDARGDPVVDYRLSRYDAGHLRRALAAAAQLLEAAGAREIWVPPIRSLLVSFHQMASCRMGASAATSVVDPGHRVWGVPGLYVADASVFPTASGVNPMLTIMAIAHRAAGVIAG